MGLLNFYIETQNARHSHRIIYQLISSANRISSEPRIVEKDRETTSNSAVFIREGLKKKKKSYGIFQNKQGLNHPEMQKKKIHTMVTPPPWVGTPTFGGRYP